MRIYGLTGGIASGKSTVRRMFQELGANVLDADAIYHDLLEPKDGRMSKLTLQIGMHFSGVVAIDGSLDRAALARIVFTDPKERRALDAIAHPAVAAEFSRRVGVLEASGVHQVLYDVPLLYENNLEKGMLGVIVVWAPLALQRNRLMQRNRLTIAEADARLAAQMSLDEKRKRANWVIDNAGNLEETRKQVEAVWKTINRA